MKDTIGYCGLDCEKCDAYIATVNVSLAPPLRSLPPRTSLSVQPPFHIPD